MKSTLPLIAILFFSCTSENSETDATNEVVDTTSVGLTDENQQPSGEEDIVNSVLIAEGSVGIFELGQEVPVLPDELKMRHFSEEETVNGKVVEHTHNIVFNQLEDVLELMMDQGSGEFHEDKLIEEIIVLSNYYETAEGLGVGSTIEDFKEQYTDATIWYSPDDQAFVLNTESVLGANFILDPAKTKKLKQPGGDNMQKMNFNQFDPKTNIKKIRCY